MTVTTVVFNRVQSRDSRVGLGLVPGLECYQAAQWTGFAFGIVGVLCFFSLPYEAYGAYCRRSFRFRWVPATLVAILSLRGIRVVAKGKKSSGRGGLLE